LAIIDINMDEEKEAKNLSIDDLFTEANYSGADCVLEQDMILGRWDNSDIKQVGYKYLKALLEQIPEGLRTEASEVINTLSYYNCDIQSVTSNDGQISLLLLDDIGLYIDLFHETDEDFIGPHSCDTTAKYIYQILKKIGHELYKFQNLKAVNEECKALHKAFRWKDIQRDDIAKGYGEIQGHRFFSYVLTQMFRGERNWECGFTYASMSSKLELSLLPFHVICYECLPYIKEERTESGIYCIETNKSVDGVNLEEYSEHTDIAIFSLVNATDPASSNITGEEILRFLGVYRLDKEKSKKENYFAFKQKDSKLRYL
jgi:hypothetical protein